MKEEISQKKKKIKIKINGAIRTSINADNIPRRYYFTPDWARIFPNPFHGLDESMHKHTHTNRHKRSHAHTNTNVHTHTHTHTNRHTYKKRPHTNVPTHTHTHTLTY